MAEAIAKKLKAQVCACGQAAQAEADLFVAVFDLPEGAFAPKNPFYRNLKDKNVAILTTLSGPIDQSRLRKTFWGSKKEFCGNWILGGYMCRNLQAPDSLISTRDVAQATSFVLQMKNKILARQEKNSQPKLMPAQASFDNTPCPL